MSVRGIGWYAGAFVGLIVAGSLIGVAAASFFASLTPLYVSIVCSFAAIACGVVAAVRARPSAVRAADTTEEETAQPVNATERDDVAEPVNAVHQDDAPPTGDPE
ncbi:MAG: hypothetical protein ACJ76A_06585 [Actinomycetota bacterium]